MRLARVVVGSVFAALYQGIGGYTLVLGYVDDPTVVSITYLGKNRDLAIHRWGRSVDMWRVEQELGNV